MLRKACCFFQPKKSSISSSSEKSDEEANNAAEPEETKNRSSTSLNDLVFTNDTTSIRFSTYKGHACAFKFTSDKEQFKTELRLHKFIKKNNIPDTIGYLGNGKLSSGYFIALERAACDLFEYLDQNPSWKVRLKIMQTTITALFYLHEHSLLHRDIKTENILITEQNRAKLCDFGLSAFAHELKETNNSLVGTFAMLAPESLSRGSYSRASDIYSFGLTLWEVASNQTVFNKIHKNTAEGYSLIQQLDIQSRKLSGIPERINSHWPKNTQKAIRHCWHPDPLQRPNSRQLITMMRKDIDHLKNAQKRMRETTSEETSQEPTFKKAKTG